MHKSSVTPDVCKFVNQQKNINVTEKQERKEKELLRNAKEAQDIGIQLGDGAALQSFAYTRRACLL